MANDMQGVVISRKVDGSWQAQHVPSKRVVHGLTKEEVELEMRALLGVGGNGDFDAPLTSAHFEGLAKQVAEFLEQDISAMLALHSGYARLDEFKDNIATVRLGGGCKGCPSSQLTLFNGVKKELQERFSAEAVVDVQPAFDS